MTDREAIEWFDRARIQFKHEPGCANHLLGWSSLHDDEHGPAVGHKLICHECKAQSEIFREELKDSWAVWFEVYDRMHGIMSMAE